MLSARLSLRRMWPYGLLLALAGIGLGSPFLLLTALAAWLLLLLPGLLLASALFTRWEERLLLGAALGYALSLLLALAWDYGPFSFSRINLLLLSGGATLAAGAVAALIGVNEGEGPPREAWLGLLAVLLVGGALRYVNLGYSEFMGDEAKVLLWATDVLQGRKDIIFLHRKGPAEILFSALHYRLVGRTSELTARMAYAGANLLGVGLLYCLGRELFGPRAGLLAGLLAAADGFLLAFGHMVQYPNLVLGLGCAAVYAAWRFYATGRRGYALALGLCLSGAALGHWDAIWLAAPVALLLGARWRHEGWRWGRMAVSAGLALAIPVAVMAAFYLPYFTRPSFQLVSRYLGDRVAGARYELRNNLSDYLTYALIYDGVHYAAGIALATLAALVALVVEAGRRPGRRWLWLASLAALVPLLVAVGASEPTRALMLGVGLALGLYLLLSRQPLAQKAAALWFLGPFLGYAYAIKKPLLSIYAYVPGMALLAGWILSRGIDRLTRKRGRSALAPLALVGLAAWYGVCVNYARLAYLDVETQYIRSYPEGRSAFYWLPWKETLPKHAGVGFPHRSGWKTLGVLYELDLLEGDYYSNEEELIVHWYTRGAVRAFSEPEYLFLAEDVKDVQEELPERDAYASVGVVTVDGEETLRILERGADGEEAPVRYAAEDFDAAFDRELSDPRLYTGRPQVDPLAQVETPLRLRVGDVLEILGARLVPVAPEAGESVDLIVHWRVLSAEQPDVRLSLRLVGEGGLGDTEEGRVYYQEDRLVGGGPISGEDWVPGQIHVDRHAILLDEMLPEGWYRVNVGAYQFVYEEGRKEARGLELQDLAHGGEPAEEVTLAKLRLGDLTLPQPEIALNVEYGDSVRLLGADLGPATVSATLTQAAATQPGGALEIGYYWQARAPMGEDYHVFSHLLDAEGQMVAQVDGVPDGGQNPTYLWSPGEVIVDRYMLPVPEDVAAGDYTLVVGLYDWSTGQRLMTRPLGRDHVVIGEVRVW